MAESETGQEKTEVATPRRREQAREEGQVPKSMEINTVLILIAGVVAFYYFAGHFYGSLGEGMRNYLFKSAVQPVNPTSITGIMLEIGYRVIRILAPFFIIIFLTALAINYAQVGFMLSPKSLQPKLSKLNPIQGLKNIFSVKGLAQLVKALVKMFVIAPVMIMTIYYMLPENMSLVNMGLKDILLHIGFKALELAIKALLIMLILAIIDYIYQRWQHEQDMKMTKEEVRQEMKDVQGDPQIKRRIRSIQTEMARQRMMEQIPEAEVVVTNPTEYAIALKYDETENPAPVVVAKGKNALAQKIRLIALEHDIPIVENKPLAQSLYKLVEVGHPIPPELYQAVAEVLAYVYRLQNKQPAGAGV